MKSRGNDFLDIFKLQAGTGWIAGVHFRATHWVTAGAAIEFDKARRTGLEGRRAVTTVSEHHGFPLALLVRPLLASLGLSGDGGHDYRDFVTDWCLRWEADGDPENLLTATNSILVFDALSLPACRKVLADDRPTGRPPVQFLDRRPIQALDIEVSGTVLPVSFLFGLSLGELADFLAGWTTLDMAGDDIMANQKAGKPPDGMAAP
jgi:hypothetical protein